MSEGTGFRFDESFRSRLLALPRRLQRRGRSDEGQLGRQRGGRQEFLEHRPYQPGDDLRDLDWNLFLRLDQLAVKEYTRGEAPEVLVLLDRSASMGEANSGKDRITREIAVALSYVASMAGAPCGLGILAQGGPVVLGRYRSSRKLDAMISLVQSLGASSGATWLEGLRYLPPPAAAGRLCYLISDFLSQKLPVAALLSLGRGSGSGCLLQVVSDAERHPELPETGVLKDAESDSELELRNAPALLAAYEAELVAHEEEVAALARQHGLSHRVVSDGAPFEEAVLAVVRGALA